MIHIIHHVDLDGMGVKLLGQLYAEQLNQPFECFKCGYAKVDWTVKECLSSFPDEMLIGDLSVSQQVAEKLDKCYKDGLQLRLRDHHAGAEWLNKYDWAEVHSDDANGIARCGTYWVAQEPEFNTTRPYFQYIIDLIDDYDTWKWADTNNLQARDLNSIFTILGDKFYPWLYNLVNSHIQSKTPIVPADIFTEEMKIMIKTREQLIQNQVHSCEYYMSVMNLWVNAPQPDGTNKEMQFTTGIIYILDNLSEVADVILKNHPELDILMLIVPPACISWRTRKTLPISLGQIANWSVGNGGGHSQAASSYVPISKSQELLSMYLDKVFQKQITYSGLGRYRG